MTFCNVLVTIRPLSAENDSKMLNRRVSKTGNLACGRIVVLYRQGIEQSTSLLSLALFLSVFRFSGKNVIQLKRLRLCSSL